MAWNQRQQQGTQQQGSQSQNAAGESGFGDQGGGGDTRGGCATDEPLKEVRGKKQQPIMLESQKLHNVRNTS